MRSAWALGVASLMLASAAGAAKMPFWGAKESRPADTPFAELQQGEFIWFGAVSRGGPLLMVVSIDEQRAYVYRNGVLTGVSTASTGKKGHETPTGVFTILQKNKDHFSNLYDNAPMPYMQRLTWGGIALHAGGLPGYPASHGCIRLPSEFARLYRAGVEIGRSRVIFHGDEPVGTHVLLMVEGAARTPQRYNPRRDTHRWVEVSIAGYGERSGREPDIALAGRIEIPPEFVALVSGLLVPGDTVLVIDEPITPATSGPQIDVINSEPPES